MLSKYALYLLFVSIGLFTNILKANELDTLPVTVKEYNISICALFKNEALYLNDWIEYHLSVGVDHFYLYNIESRDCYEQVLQSYIRKNIVTLVNWPEAITYSDDNALPWALTIQLPAYENAVNFLAKDETKWLVFLDIDEFLVPSKGTIKELLAKYCEFPGIAFFSEYFDGAIYDTLSKKTLNKDTFKITNFPQDIVDKSVAKMIFKPDQSTGFNWPPYQCRFKEFDSCIEVDQRELQVKRLINRNMIQRSFGKTQELSDLPAYPILPEEIDENCNRPIYQQVPEFLIKLKQKSLGAFALDQGDNFLITP